ncbi:MAG: PAS domain-containing protein, partial [Chloroflexota bacterium]
MAIQSNGQPKESRYRRAAGSAIVGEFDTLVNQLRDLLDTFQGRVTDYTNEMQIVAEISTQVANIREVDTLLPEIAEEIKAGFKLHHVNIYLVDDERKNLVLQAASGEEGRKLLEGDHTISLLDTRNQAAMTASIGEAIITDDVSAATDFDFHNLIPGANSEMTIPMTSQNTLVGVLAVQGAEVGRFDETDKRIKTTLGEQLAVAIESATTFQGVQAARAELGRSQGLLQTLLNNIPIRVFAKDTAGRYLFANNLFLQDANLSLPEDIVGRTDYEMPWADTEADAYTADDREVMKSGEAKVDIEEPQTQADGNVIWLSTSKVPMRGADGRTTGVLAMYQDITDRKRATERENLAYEIGQQLNTLQDPRELLQFAVDLLANALNYYHAHIYL